MESITVIGGGVPKVQVTQLMIRASGHEEIMECAKIKLKEIRDFHHLLADDMGTHGGAQLWASTDHRCLSAKAVAIKPLTMFDHWEVKRANGEWVHRTENKTWEIPISSDPWSAICVRNSDQKIITGIHARAVFREILPPPPPPPEKEYYPIN